MVLARILFWLMVAPAFAGERPACGDFLRRYVLHRESAFLILPLANGDADHSKPLALRNHADVRRYLQAHPEEPWRAELESLPAGYFKDRVVLRTEFGPTGWLRDDLKGFLGLVKTHAAAEPGRAREMLEAIARGRAQIPFLPEARMRLVWRVPVLRGDREALWLIRAVMREALVRRKLAIVDGALTTLDEVLSDDDVFFYATFPELTAFWPMRDLWNLRMPDLRRSPTLELPPVQATGAGSCGLEITRDWEGAEEIVNLRLRVRPACGEDGRKIQRWFRERWSAYLDLLAQEYRGEEPETSTRGGFDVEFDSRSSPRGLGFYVFLSERASGSGEPERQATLISPSGRGR